MADVGSLLGGLGVGGNIGKAIVQLELETTKYKAEMQAAHAQTTTATKGLGSSFSQFGGLAKTALLGVGVAAVAGLGAAVGAAVEAQRAHDRLANSVKNAEGFSKGSVAAFEAQAEAIRKVTGADDEAIISGDALLVQMGLEEDQVKSLTPLVVDLATKYDIDLQAAFKAVGKAASGNTGALARYVGAIEAGSTPAETFSNVLDKLGASAGFAAQQAKNEPWRLIKSDFEELGEEVGAALIPALQSLADGLRALMPVFKVFGEVLAETIGYVGDLIQALTLQSNGFDTYSTKLRALAEQYRSGAIDIVEFDNKLRLLRDEFGFQLEVGDEYIEQLHDARVGQQQAGRAAAALRGQLKDTSKETRKLADDFEFQTVTLDELAESTRVSRDEFTTYFRTLARESRDLRQTARELRDEEWINQDFVDFLSTKGPQWIITFGNLNETQQKRWQESWEESNKRTKSANTNLEDVKRSLDRIGGGNSLHTVKIKYEYINFDPTKPGMGGKQMP